VLARLGPLEHNNAPQGERSLDLSLSLQARGQASVRLIAAPIDAVSPSPDTNSTHLRRSSPPLRLPNLGTTADQRVDGRWAMEQAPSAPAQAEEQSTTRKTVQIADDEEHHSATATSYTISSGSDRIEVYPARPRRRRGHSSGGSTSVHSGSFTSDSSDSFVQVHGPYDEEQEEEDDIEPSDSASRSRRTTRRAHTTDRPAPTRRHSSRRIVVEREPEELPSRRHSSRRDHSSRHRRTESRRAHSDESASSVASYDDYPYSHHGRPQHPPQVPFAPSAASGYRHVPAASTHGGYAPSMMTAGAPYPHPDPFAPLHQAMPGALVHMQHSDAFGFPQPGNPFSPDGGPHNNPFSPMSNTSGNSYFTANPHAPQHPMNGAHPQRPQGRSRPQSFAAPSQFGGSHYPGSDMAMAPYAGSIHPGMAAPGMPPYYGMPAYPPVGWPYHPPSHAPSPAPAPAPKAEPAPAPAPAPVPAPAPKEEKKEVERDEKTIAELQALKDLIAKHEEARLAAEKERLAKAEAEAAAAAAKKAEEEAEKRKKEEITAASKKAKEEAEKKAEEAAKKAKEEHEKAAAKAKEEHEKALEEAKKAHEEAEKKAKELAEEVEKNKPAPDMTKAPIKFNDAVGRKFSFPWHLCKTWKGMESLIKQAFSHVDMIGEHVRQGHYDLTGPDGEIILPQVWDTMVQPDWEITMHMWPMEEPKPPKEDKLAADAAAIGDQFGGMLNFENIGLVDVVNGGPPPKKSGKPKEGKPKKGKKNSPEVMPIPPHIGGGGSPPLPPPPMPGLGGLPPDMFPPGNIVVMPDEPGSKGKPARSGSKTSKPLKKDLSPWAAWMVGAPHRPAKKDDEKLELARHKSSASNSHHSGGHGSSSHSHGHASSDQTGCVLM
jgi:hypothetical protein